MHILIISFLSFLVLPLFTLAGGGMSRPRITKAPKAPEFEKVVVLKESYRGNGMDEG